MILERTVEIAITNNDAWSYVVPIVILVSIGVFAVMIWGWCLGKIAGVVFRKETREPWLVLGNVDKKKKKRNWYYPFDSKIGYNILHLIHELLFFGGVVFLLYLGFGALGLSPLQNGFVTIAIASLMAPFFSFTAQIGAYFQIRRRGAAKLDIGRHIHFGAGMPGFEDMYVVEIDEYGVTLERYDKETDSREECFLPNTCFTSMPYKSNRYKHENRITLTMTREEAAKHQLRPPTQPQDTAILVDNDDSESSDSEFL